MKAIAIYLEGGGDGPGSNHSKRELRQGFDGLLQEQKKAARAKRLGWQVIPCGSRGQTFSAFWNDLQQGDNETVSILLVDSEDAVAPETNNPDENAQARVQHLTRRDGWDFSGTDPKQVHLMVQCMEAWMVADREPLADYYGTGFHAKSLPNRLNLEDEPKNDLLDKLKRATQKTQKGVYAKIKHASKLLERLDPAKIGKRCCRFVTFTKWLTEQIAGT